MLALLPLCGCTRLVMFVIAETHSKVSHCSCCALRESRVTSQTKSYECLTIAQHKLHASPSAAVHESTKVTVKPESKHECTLMLAVVERLLPLCNCTVIMRFWCAQAGPEQLAGNECQECLQGTAPVCLSSCPLGVALRPITQLPAALCPSGLAATAHRPDARLAVLISLHSEWLVQLFLCHIPVSDWW